MKLRLAESLCELFEGEVCRIGVELGMPAELIPRHPFPGPGVRILREATREAADVLSIADHIAIEDLRGAGWHDKTG